MGNRSRWKTCKHIVGIMRSILYIWDNYQTYPNVWVQTNKENKPKVSIKKSSPGISSPKKNLKEPFTINLKTFSQKLKLFTIVKGKDHNQIM